MGLFTLTQKITAVTMPKRSNAPVKPSTQKKTLPSTTTASPLVNARINCGSKQHDFHGDDACGTSAQGVVVADGVSGTTEASGILARALVVRVLQVLEDLTLQSTSQVVTTTEFRAAVDQATELASADVVETGRLDSTLSVLLMLPSQGQAFTYTIGDSKSIIVRAGKTVVFETTSMVYDFNVPATISTQASINSASHADVQSTTIQSGDIVVTFSDGVGDNLYVDDVVASVATQARNGPDAIAADLVQKAQVSVHQKGYIPFSVGAVAALDEYILKRAGPGQKLLQQRIKALKARTKRPIFGREKIIKQLNFYSVQHLFAFANKRNGKEDDIAVCVAIIN